MPTEQGFELGAIPSPRYELIGAPTFEPEISAPDRAAWVPAKLDVWGNNQYGDCVTAEEAFGKACYQPEIFIPSNVVVEWARRHGVLNGATLVEVLKAMQADGFKIGEQRYNDGPYQGVKWNDERILQAAIATGPVKIAMDHRALPSDAGQKQGWYRFGGHEGQYRNTDHCTSLCGYGPAGWLFEQLRVALPPGVPADKQAYLHFTWGTIGVVDHDWIMSTCVEAWIRNPTTVGVPPLPGPTPPPPPPPPPPPGPHPEGNVLHIEKPLAPGDYPLGGPHEHCPFCCPHTVGLTKEQICTIARALVALACPQK